MKTIYYKYIHFVQKPGKPKTEVWACLSNSSKELLATVKWYGPWRQYCVHFYVAQMGFSPGTVFNSACLEHMASFLKDLNFKKR